MLENERKKFKSNEKNVLASSSEHYLRKSVPNPNLNKKVREVKSSKDIGFTKKTEFHQQKQRLNELKNQKFIPLRVKNVSKGTERDTKETKIPSFFKKNTQIKQAKQKSTFQDRNIQKQQVKNQQSAIIFNDSSLLFEKNKSDESQKRNLLAVEEENLNKKISYLLNKIRDMNATLDNKRLQRLNFLESQRKERKKFIQNDANDIITPQTPLKHFITQVPKHKGLHPFANNPYSPKFSTYYVSQILRAYRQQNSLARQHLFCSIQYLRMFQNFALPTQKQIAHMKVNLQKMKGYEDKKTVVFDLDETLIHCNESLNGPNDFRIKINFPTGQIVQAAINVRPFARQILATLSKNFQVIVFTASHSCYANVVLDQLDPERKYIHHRLFRESCYCTSEGIYVKDLRIINRPLEKMILIDNAAYSYAFQPLNGVPIIPYYEGRNDYELQALLKYIQTLAFLDDVREKNRATFKLDQYHRFDDLHHLVQTLYSEVRN